MSDILIMTAATPHNDSAAVQHNLDHAAATQALDGEVHASTEAHGGPDAAAHGPEPTALMMNATAWVSLAMLIFIGILLWKKVPAMIAAVLDSRIADIRKNLDEAAALRKEAEVLKAEYEAKIAAAAKDADALRVSAEAEAAALVETARANASDLIARRRKMAEDKIAAAERTAIADLRTRAADAATAAAAALIRDNHGASADSAMVDQAIRQIGSTH